MVAEVEQKIKVGVLLALATFMTFSYISVESFYAMVDLSKGRSERSLSVRSSVLGVSETSRAVVENIQSEIYVDNSSTGAATVRIKSDTPTLIKKAYLFFEVDGQLDIANYSCDQRYDCSVEREGSMLKILLSLKTIHQSDLGAETTHDLVQLIYPLGDGAFISYTEGVGQNTYISSNDGVEHTLVAPSTTLYVGQ